MSKNYTLWISIGVVIVLAFWGINSYNQLNSLEKGIVTADKATVLALDTLMNTARSQGLVLKGREDTFLKALQQVTSARENLSSLVTVLKEENYNLPDSLYDRLLITLESGYADLRDKQVRQQDMVRELETSCSSLPTVVICSLARFPRIDMARYAQPIVSQEASEAGDTRRITPLNPLQTTP